MKAAAHAKFSEMLLLNGNGVVIRLIAETSVGRVHSNITSSTVQSGGREIGVLKGQCQFTEQIGSLTEMDTLGSCAFDDGPFCQELLR